MITFKRDGMSVIAAVHAGPLLHKEGTYFELVWQAGSETCAELLMRHLRDRYRHEIEETRRAEYERGWKDAKSHRGLKRTWFRPFLGGDAS